MAYVIRDSKTKSGLIFNAPIKRRFKAEAPEGEQDAPVDAPDPNQEEEEEVIPEEDTVEMGYVEESSSIIDTPVELARVNEDEQGGSEEEEDDSECDPTGDENQCGPGMWCSFDGGGTCQQEGYEEQWEHGEEEEEDKEPLIKEPMSFVDIKSKIEKNMRVVDTTIPPKEDTTPTPIDTTPTSTKDTSKTSTTKTKSSGGGGGGGGGGKYMTKNDKLWKKKLSKKGVVSKVSTSDGKGSLKLIGLGVLSVGGFFAYKKYGGLKKKAGKLDKIKSIMGNE